MEGEVVVIGESGERDLGAEDYLPPDGVCFSCDEAVEVEGEPVSHYEACRMGVFVDAATDVSTSPSRVPPIPERAPRAAEAAEPATQPSRASTDMEEKIRAAVALLDAGKAEDALALAQEAVREYPSLAAPRVVMARAFMGLGDYAKAQAILMALPAAEQTAETLYYRGLASASIGRHENAAKLLESALTLPAANPETHGRAQELLARLRCSSSPGEPASSNPAGPMEAGATARPRPVPRINRRGRPRKPFPVLVVLLVLAACLCGFYFGCKLFAPELLDSQIQQLPALWAGLAEAASSLFR